MLAQRCTRQCIQPASSHLLLDLLIPKLGVVPYEPATKAC